MEKTHLGKVLLAVKERVQQSTAFEKIPHLSMSIWGKAAGLRSRIGNGRKNPYVPNLPVVGWLSPRALVTMPAYYKLLLFRVSSVRCLVNVRPRGLDNKHIYIL
ncbi:uncharacterized protein MCYG_04622 [Microsporum canis CBS 113480]|uniref:Uncharacterized protein n=1 Tax=Arthroderma otae (strain ATCC MYA-4605 / CBS 113480) TaxID=554155 RepID=C5FNV0_ARTOC|nr:uncharacterized protein MCYG_04622 [Microsporum canis CBS 113480]EEQ31803.1 hypothetical protein MCYG_04622 [Microsporum canis CBS 113480]